MFSMGRASRAIRLRLCWSVVALFVSISSLSVDISFGTDTDVRLASRVEAEKLIGTRDGFVASLSKFDRSARLHTGREVSEAEFLVHLVAQIRPMTEAEGPRLRTILGSIERKLLSQKLVLRFPETILLIKTTGQEEGNAAYCRANAIILPEGVLAKPDAALEKVIEHELFHILSRANLLLRRDLYTIVGFSACPGVAFPAPLVDLKITNPDAYENDSCMEVSYEGRQARVLPVLFPSSPKYDPARKGEFFDYLVFKLLLVQEKGQKEAGRSVEKEPILLDPSMVPDYIRKGSSKLAPHGLASRVRCGIGSSLGRVIATRRKCSVRQERRLR